MKHLALGALATAFCIASTSAASFYIGDATAEGTAMTPGGIGPDGANGGAITYAFFSPADRYTNNSGLPQLLQVTEVNFNAANSGTLTPFVAVLLGGGALGADYNVLARGDGIAGAGLTNASFMIGGLNPTITLNNGETLIAGFHQTGGPGMIPWNSPGGADGDYLSLGGIGGNTIPPGGTGALTADANWSTLGREYRFNVGFDVVPEPSVPFFLIPGAFFAMLIRRRRTN